MEQKLKTFKVQKEMELLGFLLVNCRGKSRNNVKSLLSREQITVDGKKVKQFNTLLKMGQNVEIHANPVKQITLPFTIIYEDDEFIIIDKPEGMLTVSADNEKEKTAYHFLMEYIRGKNPQGRIFIVHRLDRETSGILLFTKNEKLKLKLQENWSELALKRGYTAIVEGCVKQKNGEIRTWLKQTKTLLVYSDLKGREGGGKEAVTLFETIRKGDEYSLLKITLKTGRKNQIRVHMKDLGHPVVGDIKYGAKKINPFNRFGLHADYLVIKHPYSGKEIEFKSKIPKIFLKGIK